jgi:hypothetical protein
VAFEGAYEALLLNGFNAPHSRRANCEAGGSECLQTLKFFLKKVHVTPDVSHDFKFKNDNFNFNIELGEISGDVPGQGSYVCGWVLKKCLKMIVKSCQHCRNDLQHFNNKVQ